MYVPFNWDEEKIQWFYQLVLSKLELLRIDLDFSEAKKLSLCKTLVDFMIPIYKKSHIQWLLPIIDSIYIN